MDLTESERRDLDSLSSQFNILVLISTFTAALIISFLSLAQSVIGDASGKPYQFGLFFSAIAIGFHLLAVIVASRAGMLSFRLSKSIESENTQEPQTEDPHTGSVDSRTSVTGIYTRPPGPQLRLVDFQRFLVLCEQLQLVGTTIYIPPALFLLYYMFRDVQFVIAIYVITGIGALVVYRLGFWKVSLLWHDLHHVGSRFKEMILKAGRMGRKN